MKHVPFAFLQKKLNTVADNEMKSKLLHAMTISDNRAHEYVKYFSASDFALIPNVDANANGYRIWTAQRGDVTALVWERGADVQNWIAKIQSW